MSCSETRTSGGLVIRSACLLLILVSACSSHVKTSPASQPRPARATSISLTRQPTFCFGRCPTYTVRMDSTGIVYFIDLREPSHSDSARVSLSAFDSLSDALVNSGFLALDSAYAPGHPLCRSIKTDHSDVTLTFDNTGQHKSVLFYDGCVDDRRLPADSIWSCPVSVDG